MSDRIPATDRDLVVFGALRSGSTLLRLMINSHPALYCNGEHDYLFDHLRFDQTSKTWRLDYPALLRDRIFLSSGLIADQGASPGCAILDLIGQLRTRSEQGRVVLMIHRNLDRAISILKEPLVVHLIRDPRDVAYSSIGMGWAGNVYYGADHWIHTENEWVEFGDRLPPSAKHRLLFETLVADPSGELRRLCNFFAIPYDEKMLDYHKVTSYEPVNSSLATQWKTSRTEREIALVELRVGKLMELSGFQSSAGKNIELAAFDKLYLWLQNKRYIWKFRFKRYGVFDPIWSAIARRIGAPKLAERAIFRMHLRTKKYLK